MASFLGHDGAGEAAIECHNGQQLSGAPWLAQRHE